MRKVIGYTRRGSPVFEIAGGANETTTTTASSTVYAKAITADILQELRPYDVHREFFRTATARPSKVYSFTKQTKVAPTAIASITEGADQSTLTAISTGNADATAAQKGVISFITDLLVVVSVLDALPQFSAVLARTAMEQYETDLAAAPAFTNVTGSSANTQSVANILKAKTALAGRDVTGPLVCIQHTKQVGDIQLDISSSGAAWYAGDSNKATPLLDTELGGVIPNLMGVTMRQTSVVPTADSAASRAGYMFVAGQALGLYELWNIRTELQRDASKVGTEVVLTMAYGTVEIDDPRGQTLKSAA